MALLTQNPGDYLVRERVGDELPGEQGAAALRIVGLEHAVDADPRDLSGGERQRLALAIALAGRMDGERLPGLVALDEPTRGMDRARKDDLVELIEGLARARRRGHRRHPRRRVRRRLRRAGRAARRRRRDRRRRRPRRSSPAAGTSRPRSPASSTCPGVITPEAGRPSARRAGRAMSWELASFLILGAVLLAGFAWYERSRPPAQVVALVAALAALAIAGRIAFAAFPNVKPTTDIVVFAGYALGGAPGFAVGGADRAGLQLLVRPGAVDAVADGGLGDVRAAGRRRWPLGGRERRPSDARRRMRVCRHRLRRLAEFLPDGNIWRGSVARALPRPRVDERSRSTPPTRSATSSSPSSPARR